MALTELPNGNPIGYEQRFDCVALFADVSGFTAMSEALATTGRSGAEELTALLNQYFEPMIDLIHSFGGIIGRFGGDAMTVLFPYEADNCAAVVRRALQCALQMQASMDAYTNIRTQVGTFNLAMKAGLAMGQVFCTSVGHLEKRLEYIIAGGVLNRSADAEHHATRGEVVAHRALLAWAGAVELVEERGEFVCLRRLVEPEAPQPLPAQVTLSKQARELVAAYLHPSIAQRLRGGQSSFINEHRKVTILFVSFEGFDYDTDPQVGAKLQHYLSQVIDTIHHYKGYLDKVSMGDKGSSYIVLFGAPVAYENSEEGALYCALALQALEGPRIRVGVNSGFVYCGQVGSAVRQEYTVMGDAVNLAARLMQAAEPGQILVGEATYHTIEGKFMWDPPLTLQVKGKKEAIYPRNLLGQREQSARQMQRARYSLPMVGRQPELQQIMERLDLAARGEGQIVGITAEAGMGKSRLADEAFHLAMERGVSTLVSECSSHGTTISYHLWRSLIGGFFGLESSWPLARQVQHLQQQLARIDPALVLRLPLLGRVLNLPIPDNDLTRSLEGRLRKDSLEALIVDCVRHFTQDTPHLLLLEDCQWMDPLSHDLLENLARHSADRPLLLLLVYRSPESEWMRPRVTRFGHFTEIELKEFTQDEAEYLIQIKLQQFFGSQQTLPTALIERVTARAQGNPFYIDEMINLIHDRKIDPTDLKALEALDLPDSLHSLIISRIDQLKEGTKSTLKVASVIGRVFREDWLWGSYPQLGSPERIHRRLERLRELDLTALEKQGPEVEYLFKHIVTREVAYESLALATRTMLHERIGHYIESSYPDQLEQYLDLLAYHFGQSANIAKQRDYFQRAGASAQASYANEAALDYYRRLLPLLDEAEKAPILLQMGQILQLTGQWGEAEQHYRQAFQLASTYQEEALLAEAQHALGTLLRARGNYTEALEWLEQAQSRFMALPRPDRAIDTLIDIGVIYWLQGDFSLALHSYESCLAKARALGDKQVMCRALGNMGLLYTDLDDHERALKAHEEGYQIAVELNDPLKMRVLIGNAGNLYLKQGNYSQALESYVRSLHLAVELGHSQGITIRLNNLGTVYLEQGELERATLCLNRSLQLALELGDPLGVITTLGELARVHLLEGEEVEAMQLTEYGIALAYQLEDLYELCEALNFKSRLLMRQHRYRGARAANEEARKAAEEMEHQEVLFESQVREILLSAIQGEQSQEAALAQLNALRADWSAPSEQAALCYAMWKLCPTDEKIRREAAQHYHALYKQVPHIDYRERYRTLTAQALPLPPPLPAPPELVTRHQIPLARLLAQAAQLLSPEAA